MAGRLQQSNLGEKVMHLVMLCVTQERRKANRNDHQMVSTKDCTYSIVEMKSEHQDIGRFNSAVEEVISRCVTCRRLRGKVGKQILAD